jgi:hypothetical protein
MKPATPAKREFRNRPTKTDQTEDEMSAVQPTTVKVTIADASKPITFQATGDYQTRGVSKLIYYKRGSPDDDPGITTNLQVKDNLADTKVLDLTGGEIECAEVFGDYRPAPGHTRVKVTYAFLQDKNPLKTDGSCVFEQDPAGALAQDDREFKFIVVS